MCVDWPTESPSISSTKTSEQDDEAAKSGMQGGTPEVDATPATQERRDMTRLACANDVSQGKGRSSLHL